MVYYNHSKGKQTEATGREGKKMAEDYMSRILSATAEELEAILIEIEENEEISPRRYYYLRHVIISCIYADYL